MPRLPLLIFGILFACCLYQAKAIAASAREGHARFEVFGILDEYGHRFIDARTVERFYPHEVFIAARFGRLLEEFCAEEGIEPTFEKEVNDQGFTTFFSPVIAARINHYYTEGGLLNGSVFFDSSTNDLIRYVQGAFRRDGDSKGIAIFSLANGTDKMTQVGNALQKLGCSHVQLYLLEGFPSMITLVFSPSKLVKRRLSLWAEAKVAKTQDLGKRLPLKPWSRS